VHFMQEAKCVDDFPSKEASEIERERARERERERQRERAIKRERGTFIRVVPQQ
jgi:hypothetical protein